MYFSPIPPYSASHKINKGIMGVPYKKALNLVEN